MIVDVSTGKVLFDKLVGQPNTHDDPKAAYTTWADELGLPSSVTLPGLYLGDDGVGEIQLGFTPTIEGVSDKLMQSGEGSIAFYTSEPDGSVTSLLRPLKKVLDEQVNVTRDFTSRALNQPWLITCKHPMTDSRSQNGLWQKTTSEAILYIEWLPYGGGLGVTKLAIRISRGSLEVVFQSDTKDGAYFQTFLLDPSSSSGQAIAGDGNMGLQLTPLTVYCYKTQPLQRIFGTVMGMNGQPASNRVRVYDRRSGELSADGLSDPVDGTYSLEVPSGEYYLVCLDDSGDDLNALIFDRVLSVE